MWRYLLDRWQEARRNDGPTSSAQRAVLKALAGFEPRWTLTEGAALAGFYLGHRVTRDLGLFWHGHDALGDLAAQVSGTLVLVDTKLEAGGFYEKLGFIKLGVFAGELGDRPVPTSMCLPLGSMPQGVV